MIWDCGFWIWQIGNRKSEINIGDIKTHIVKIDTRANASMFTADGKFATGVTTVDFACLRCHGSRDKAWAANYARGIHTRGK